MPYLNRGNDTRIHYQVDGNGPPILLTHGFAASVSMWDGQVAAFQDRVQLVRWDMRGHGDTQTPNDPALFSQGGTVDDMAALLDSLDIDQAIIGGHSLGGFMSLAFNVAHPDRVKALFLQGCGPGYRSDASRATWNERAENRARSIEQGGLDAVGGAAEVSVSTLGSPQGLANAARGILSQVDASVIDSLPHIDVPTLIVTGTGDAPYVQGANYMASRIPGARHVLVEDAGHGVNIDQPTVVNDALSTFFDLAT
ncbi:MAG: alpha/beta fold hydrolase [Chromatiales bacterium]|jgi:pimeloyl-ACP methyl ester carboxylesterase|nr:alpha/beta fold hydrolase [Chromatiales bacterium]